MASAQRRICIVNEIWQEFAVSRKYTIDQIKALTLILRKHVGFESAEYLDMRALLKAVKRLYPSLTILQVRNDELSDADGMYDPATHTLRIPDRVFGALDKGVPRARFSLAHEIAHPLLGHRNIRFRHAEKRAYEYGSQTVSREETQANRFAAFLLAPDQLCVGCETIEDFMERFGLSRSAAEIRKDDYNRYLRHQHRQERELPPNAVDLLKYLRSKGHKVTSLKDEARQVRSTGERQPPPSSRQSSNII